MPLPAAWPTHVRSAVIHTMSLAAAALTATRGWAAKHASSRVRLQAENERLTQELALANEELRLKDARMFRMPTRQRPHFAPVDRLAILELRAVRGWSMEQTAERFQLSPLTVTNWMRRLNERGPRALIQSPAPLNKYPNYITHIVQQLKVKCPSLGYGKIAHALGREGLRLGTSTVSRMLRRRVELEGEPEPVGRSNPMKKVIARHPHHAWHCDLTTVPTSMGIWTSTVPFSFAQRWPFCWWVMVLADQFSARILGLAVFERQPTTDDVRALVTRAVVDTGAVPEYLITDKGHQFRDRTFRPWCKRMGIRHLFGALGQFGSIPFIERLIRTIKWECTRRILFPYSARAARKELDLFTIWYNRARPHERLRGATPEEIHDGAELPCHRPRGVGSASSPPRIARLALRVRYLEGRKHLPMVSLDRVA